MKKFMINSLTLAAGLCAAQMAAALDNNATSDINGVVVDPFTNQTVQVWKRGGYIRIPGDPGICSATQIHPNWIYTARHCSPSTHLFYSPSQVSSTASALSACYDGPDGSDISICRLTTPALYSTNAPYPVLSDAPPINSTVVLSGSIEEGNKRVWKAGKDRKYGHYMAMGWAGPQNKFLQFVDAYSRVFGTAQIPLADWRFVQTVTSGDVGVVPGDSGGGMFWVNGSPEPVLIGHMRFNTLVTWSFEPLDTADLAWISNTIAAAGDSPPTTAGWQSMYSGSTSLLPSDLPQPPAISLSSNGTTATVTWSTPTAYALQAPLASYTLTRGILSVAGTPGRLDGKVTGIPVGTNSYVLSGLSAFKNQTVCISPVDNEGQSTLAPGMSSISAFSWDPAPPVGKWTTEYSGENCITFDNRLPAAAQISWTQRNQTATSRLLTSSWTLPAQPDVALSKYRVTRTVKYPTGPARTTVFEQTSTSSSITVQVGTTVCDTVQSISKFGLKTNSSNQCRTAN